ncbi:MAG: class I SAM-dependent methyltransferase [Flavobacterium sp.]|nr:class I SAM-dependent methyltransferase [Candidatus Neoflavobacterium equi]
MIDLVFSYIKYLYKSKNEHGVHSPFLFNFVTKCLYDRGPKPDYKLLKSYRERLLNNEQTIVVTDFGAGSRVFNSNVRAINKIAQTAGITHKRAQLLYRVIHYFKPQNILEIGTSLGLATVALSKGNTNANITTVEGCPATAAVAFEQFQHFNLTNINTQVREFEAYFDQLEDSKFDLIYFDGNHQKDATLRYFNSLLKTVTNDSIWIFDDIHWSASMESAWEEIKKHPQVTVTMDTYQWGFVFFRKEQNKEHFTIRV